MMDPAHIAYMVTGGIAVIGGFWAVFKSFGTFYMKTINKRLDTQDALLKEAGTALTQILQELASIKAGRVGFMTSEQCALNNKRFEDRYDAKISEIKTDVMGEVEAVESRLSKRIDRLEGGH